MLKILQSVLRNSKVNRTTSSFYTGKRYFSDEVSKAKSAAADKNKKTEVTIFDRIRKKEIAAEIIYEDVKCMAFNDASPQAPVHFLIIPKEKGKLNMIENATAGDIKILGHLLYIASLLGKKNAPDGYRIVINNGEHGAQSVKYLHLHVMGGRQMQWPPG